MDSINEVRSMTARTTSESQMENPNSTNIAGFHQSGTICPGMPLLSSKNVDSINEVRTKTARPPPADNQIGNRTSTDMAGYSQSDMILPEMPLPSSEGRSNHYKTCMHHCPCLGETTTLHQIALRELWTATKKYQQRQPAFPQITRWAIQTAQNSRNSSIGHTFPWNATAFIKRQIKPL